MKNFLIVVFRFSYLLKMSIVSQIRTDEEYDAVVRNGLVVVKFCTQEYGKMFRIILS
jgi:hypothetical protein